MKVSISCITFNHSPYIRQCLDGFLMQECDFDYEILIHDDASTDGTIDIIKEYQKKYPNLIKPIIQTQNQYSKGVRGINIKFNVPRAKGKYIALCEGDDYWTDPRKLQKQVDFLEVNSDVSVTYHNVFRFDHNTNKLLHKAYYNEDLFLSEKEIILAGGKITPTLSAVFRSKYLQTNPDWLLNSPVGDLALTFFLMSKGKVYFFKDSMGVYRENLPGSWTVSKKNNNTLENIIFKLKFTIFIRKFNNITQNKYKGELTSVYYNENSLNYHLLNFAAYLYEKTRQ